MKRVLTWVLAVCMLLCMVLNGCRREEQPQLSDTSTATQTQTQPETNTPATQQSTDETAEASQQESTAAPVESDATENTESTKPEATQKKEPSGNDDPVQTAPPATSGGVSSTVTDGTVPMDPTMEQEQGTELVIGETGKVRLSYSVNYSSVKYVTSVSELPDCDGLEAFDDAYFQDHALLIVIETVSSGSVDTGIQSAMADGSSAVVTLYHETKSGVVTADMTTWLLWAEVDKGLDYSWTVSNPAVESDTSKY